MFGGNLHARRASGLIRALDLALVLDTYGDKKMSKIDGNLINDYEFVHWAADLLRRFGFIDVDVQV